MRPSTAVLPIAEVICLLLTLVTLLRVLGLARDLTRRTRTSKQPQLQPSSFFAGVATLPDVANRPLQWGSVRPLGTELSRLTTAASEAQLRKLHEARDLVRRMEAAKASSDDTFSFSCEPDEHSFFEVSFAFVGDGEVYFSEVGRAFPLGLLPWCALVREIDAVHDHLPPAIRRLVERLAVRHAFAPNDVLYSMRVRGFGPIPGLDLVPNVTLFDVADEPGERASIIAHVESPPADLRRFRDVEIAPPPPGYHRAASSKIVGFITPSRESAGFAHGRINFMVTGKVRMPISRWLLPTPLIRWFMPLVLRLVLPLFARLNAGFDGSTLCERMQSDADFYAEIQRRLPTFRTKTI
jgi:hypothetical protein